MPDALRPVFHPDHADRVAEAAFWRATFKGGARYKRARDEAGDAILPRYEYETKKMYDARLAGTLVFNVAEDLVGRRIGEVFGQPIARPAADGDLKDALFADFLKNVNRERCGIDEWMSERFEEALIAGRVFVGVDAPPTTEEQAALTRADVMKQPNMLPYFVHACVENVVDWSEEAGTLTRIVIRYVTRSKAKFTDKASESTHYVEWKPTTFTKYTEKKDGESVELVAGEEMPHDFGCVPWRKLDLPPYVGRFADAIKTATRTHSHMFAEEVASVFTLPIFTGVSPEELAKVFEAMGPGGAIAIKNENAEATTLSHDPAVMATLRENLAMAMAEALRRGEPAASAQTVQPKSGVAHAYEFLSIEALDQRFAAELEACENWLLELWAKASGVDPAKVATTQYPREFDVLSDEALFTRFQWLLERTGLPVEVQRMSLKAIFGRLFTADDEQRKAAMTAIDSWSPSAGASLLSRGIADARTPRVGLPPTPTGNLIS